MYMYISLYLHSITHIFFTIISFIFQEFFQFQFLSILYMHGNQINDIKEVLKLKSLLKLRTLTLHGNPISRLTKYRCLVLFYLPQIKSLDFSLITRHEKSVAPPILCTVKNNYK
jgi:hypothetical protein